LLNIHFIRVLAFSGNQAETLASAKASKSRAIRRKQFIVDLLGQQPGGDSVIQKFASKPIGAEAISRSYDFWRGTMEDRSPSVNRNPFSQSFTNEIEFVRVTPCLSLSLACCCDASGFGAAITIADLASGRRNRP